MLFSVGMAIFDDPECPTEVNRAVFTAMSLVAHHPLVGEVLVVDNNPQGQASAGLARLLDSTGKGRYVPMTSPQGTSAPRNRVFKEAKYDHVVCIDAHVLLASGSLEALREFYLTHPDSLDLVHGTMVGEDMATYATHMNDQWREEMWGTWGRAWQHPTGFMFSCLTRDDKSLEYVSLDDRVGEQRTLLTGDFRSVAIPWAGHEAKLRAAGCTEPVMPFRVPGHGMGFFACKKEAWLPFHPDARGFGGEEMTTGVRYRQAGRTCWTVPGVRWWHHFNRNVGRPPYRLSVWDKARNYFIEFRRLGLDVKPIKEHFVETGRVPEQEWQQLLDGMNWPVKVSGVNNTKDRPWDMPPDDAAAAAKWAAVSAPAPEAVPEGTGPPKASQNGQRRVLVGLDGLFDAIAEQPDAAPDLYLMRELAARGGPDYGPADVIELGTGRADVTTSLLAGRPKSLTTYDLKIMGSRANLLKQLTPPGTTYQTLMGDVGKIEAKECDVLIIRPDQEDKDRVHAILWKYNMAAKVMVIQGTSSAIVKAGVEEFLDHFRYSTTPAPGSYWKQVHVMPSKAGVTILTRLVGIKSKFQWPPPPLPQSQARQAVVRMPPTHGPGTEMKAIIAGLGVNPAPNCDCNAKAAQMDMWGVAGCKENRETIIGWLRDGQGRWGWKDKLVAAARAVATGLVFRLNPTDPFPGIVDEAIRRAEDKVKVSD